MIRVFIIGFPHTATTYCYKISLQQFGGCLGIFEPFNAEVVGWCLTSKEVHHYSEGKVKHHLLEIPVFIKDLIEKNANWLWDWVYNDKPSTPFLGRYWKMILRELDNLRFKVIVKDVIAWVKLEEIVELLPNTHFIVTIKDDQSVLNDFLKLYWKVAEEIKHPRWGLGLSLFYRYFHGVTSYPKRFDRNTLRELFNDTYTRYKQIVALVSNHSKYASRVHVIHFEKRLQKEQLLNVLGKIKKAYIQ